jgi:C2 domain
VSYSFTIGRIFRIYNASKVVAADGLAKRDVFRLPDPFAVITVDSEQTHTTSVIKKTLNPYWNEVFDMSVILFSLRHAAYLTFPRMTNGQYGQGFIRRRSSDL